MPTHLQARQEVDASKEPATTQKEKSWASCGWDWEPYCPHGILKGILLPPILKPHSDLILQVWGQPHITYTTHLQRLQATDFTSLGTGSSGSLSLPLLPTPMVGIESKVLCMLGKHSTTWAILITLLFLRQGFVAFLAGLASNFNPSASQEAGTLGMYYNI